MSLIDDINRIRCPICGVALRDGDQVLWCYEDRCPETELRKPTERMVQTYQIDTRILNKLGWEPGMQANPRKPSPPPQAGPDTQSSV